MKEWVIVYLESKYHSIIRNLTLKGSKSECIDYFNELYPKAILLNVIEK